MNESYLNSVKNTVLSSKPSIAIRLLLMVLFVLQICKCKILNNKMVLTNSMDKALLKNTFFAFILLFFTIHSSAQTFVGPGTDWNTASNWSPSGVPSASISGTITINSNVNVASITVNNKGALIVNSPAVLTVGTIGNSASTQVVDFQNGSKVTVNSGASLVVYGELNNSNNSNDVKFDGVVSIDGNVTVGNGSTIAGSGNMSSTGTVTGAGTVFGSVNDCTTGNCNYGCSINANTISANQNICTGSTVVLTGNSDTGYSYQWQFSTTSASTGFANVASGGTSSNYTTPSLTTTTYYRRIVSASGCSSSSYSNVVQVTVSSSVPGTPGVITGTSAQCASVTGQIYSVAAVSGAISYTWYVPTGWTITSGQGTTSITVTTGTAGQNGNIQVNAINACGIGYSPSQYVTVNPIPSAPGTSSPDSAICTGFRAQWAWTANATKYYLDVATDNGFTSIVPAYNNLDVGNNLTYVLTGLTPGTTYYYRVRAYSSCGTSSSSVTMTYATSPIPTVAPVANPATNPDCSAVTVNWNMVANATGYYLDIATDSGFTSFVSGYNNYNVAYPATSFYAGGLPAGTLYYRLRGYNSCGIITANSNTISFSTTAPIGGSVSSAQTIYSGTSPSNLTLSGYTTTNTAIIKWQKSSDATFSIPIDISNTTATLTGATIGNLTANTYFRAVVQNQFDSWCVSNSNPVLITVMVVAAPLPPTATVVHPNCALSTGSVTVTSPVPAADITYTVVGTNPVVAGVTNTTGVFSGLTAGDYNVIVNNTATGLSTGKSETINAIVTNTWNGAAWSNGTPNSNQKIVFSGNYPPATDPDVDINGCSCKVTGSVNVTIKAGRNLLITNEVEVVGTGTLTFEDTASLVQTNDAAINSGNIIYKRTTSSVRFSDYTYWSSPVANQNLSISPSYASGMFYSYDDFAVPEDWKGESASTEMLVGKGYIIRGPQINGLPPAPGLYYATFVGEPNNGIKTIAIGPAGTSNLLGNPYPSAINADTFLANNNALIEGTIYFWTHNTAIKSASSITNGTAGSGVLAYTSDDYASYNTTGGVATGNFVNGNEEIENRPTGKIAAGQAFFTTSKATGGSVAFNNAMRLAGTTLVDKTGVNQQFFKTKNTNTKTANTIEKHRVWLNMTNAEGAFKQTLVGYVTDATNDYDSRFDGESFDGNQFVDFYSINQDKNLVIQGRALPFDENDEVPLGYRTTISGTFSINIGQVDGVLANQSVFLEDKLTNTVSDLKNEKYTFDTAAGTFDDRFVLKYSNKTLATADIDAAVSQVVVSVKSKQIKINSFVETIDKILIYDVLGRQVYKKDNVDGSELLITDFVSSHQVLIVKTILQNGKMVTDKIIY